jgi:FixJ family two-component response regulator
VASHRPGVRQSARRTRDDGAPVIFIIDADDETRADLQRVLGAFYETRAFPSASAFFAAHDPEVHGCIIIDSSSPAAEGLQTLARLKATHCGQPVIFLSAAASIATTVRALRAGAVNFLTRPVGSEVLLAAVDDALVLEATRHESVDRRRAASKRLSALTLRERQVLSCLVSGMLNKQIAAELGIVENTVKAHRARIMQKLAVRSLAELVFLASTTDPEAASPRHLAEYRNVR